MLLQGAVEECGSVGECDRGLERGERRRGQPDPVEFLDLGGVQVTAAEPDAWLGPGAGVGRDGELDHRGGIVEHAVPVGGGRSGDHGERAAPQPCGADAGLGSAAVAADQVDAGVQPLPAALLDPALRGVGGHPGRDGLGEGDHTGLAGDQPLEGHAEHGRPGACLLVAIPRNSAP
jgi:hypothetical protein